MLAAAQATTVGPVPVIHPPVPLYAVDIKTWVSYACC